MPFTKRAKRVRVSSSNCKIAALRESCVCVWIRYRNKDRQIEESSEKNEEELKFYKQKVKHLQYEHQLNLTDAKAEAMVSIKLARDDHAVQERELLRDKRELKAKSREQEMANQDHIKNLKLVCAPCRRRPQDVHNKVSFFHSNSARNSTMLVRSSRRRRKKLNLNTKRSLISCVKNLVFSTRWR